MMMPARPNSMTKWNTTQVEAFLGAFHDPNNIDDDDVSQVVQHPPRVIVCVLLEPRNCLSSSSVTTASHSSEWPEFPCQEISPVLVLVITLWPAGKSFAYNNFWHLQLPRLEGGQCNNNNNCNHNAPSQFSHTTPRLFAGQLQSHYCC